MKRTTKRAIIFAAAALGSLVTLAVPEPGWNYFGRSLAIIFLTLMMAELYEEHAK